METLTKPRWRRRGQCRFNNEFMFYLRILRYSYNKSFTCFSLSKLSLNPKPSDKFEIKIKKISCCGVPSPDNTKFGHFTSSSCWERQRNVPRIIAHMHSHCAALQFLCSMTFPLPLAPWFCKLPIILKILFLTCAILNIGEYYLDIPQF